MRPGRIVLAMALLGVAGCGYFRPANPEKPAVGTSISTNYRNPDSTLETLAHGIADKGASNGLAAYIGGFADSTSSGREFHAFFDAVTVNRLQQIGVVIPADWDRGREEEFYARFVTLSAAPSSADYIFQWIKDETLGEDDYASDPVVLHREYRVFASLGGESQYIAHGFATLYLAKLGSQFLLVRWDDREAPGANLAAGEVCFGQRRLEP